MGGIGDLLGGIESSGLTGFLTGLYTDESPGLKVDPVVVLVLSVGFIISVVALHGKLHFACSCVSCGLTVSVVIAKITKRFSS